MQNIVKQTRKKVTLTRKSKANQKNIFLSYTMINVIKFPPHR